MEKIISVLKSEKRSGHGWYGLIIALVSIAVIVAITALGSNEQHFQYHQHTMRDIQP